MVAVYYTATFERNSLAEISQRASRRRRLLKLVQSLYESSNHWSKWESRGLRDSIMKDARELSYNSQNIPGAAPDISVVESIYIDELESVTKDHALSPRRSSMNTPEKSWRCHNDTTSSERDAGHRRLGPSLLSSLAALTNDTDTLFQDEAR